jgi:type II secretory pathway pseudopilin PulG
MHFEYEMRSFRKPRPGKRSFTLMEMMAVVAIIMILAGLTIPTIGYAKRQARAAKAREDVNNLRVALRSYYQEYGAWPNATTSWTEFSSMLNGNINPYSGAAGPGYAASNNARAIRFLEFRKESVNASAEYLDPWGTAYVVLMDHGGAAVGKAGWSDDAGFVPPGAEDGQLPNPAGGNRVQAPLAVYSFGPDKTDDNGGNDDVKTWN